MILLKRKSLLSMCMILVMSVSLIITGCAPTGEASSEISSADTSENIESSQVESSDPYADITPTEENSKRMSDFLGFVGGTNAKYQFNEGREVVLEMADVALELGSKIYKTSLHFGRSELGDTSLVQTVQRDIIKELFEMDFNTYVLTSHPFLGGNTNKWMDGVTRETAQEIRDEMYELTKYLLTEYEDTGKTFVLQNWEADELVSLNGLSDPVRERRIQAFVDWTNMMQDGVTLAREEVGMNNVWVVFAIETNHVPGAKFWDYPVLMDTAFPQTNADIYSGSIWSSTLKGEGTKEALDYYADHTPGSLLYGEKNIYYGEFGSKEFSFPDKDGKTGGREVYDDYTGIPKMEEEKNEILAALDWGVQFMCFWQVYCNGLLPGFTVEEGEMATNNQLMGVWLIRADGSKTPTYDYFEELLETNDFIYHPDRIVKLANYAPGEETSYRRPADLSEFPETLGAQINKDNAVIVDFNSSGFSTEGKWSSSSSIFYGSEKSLFTREFDAKAIFTPELDAGKYEVYVYNLYSGISHDDSHTQFNIMHNGEESTKVINTAEELKNAWIKVGEFEFDGSGSESVSISKIFEGTKVVRASGMAFKPVD